MQFHFVVSIFCRFLVRYRTCQYWKHFCFTALNVKQYGKFGFSLDLDCDVKVSNVGKKMAAAIHRITCMHLCNVFNDHAFDTSHKFDIRFLLFDSVFFDKRVATFFIKEL